MPFIRSGPFAHLPSRSEDGRNGGVSDSRFLHAGQVFASAAGTNVVLILGSCVAVCLWDPVSGVGGATHYLLPVWDGRGTSSARYGNVAIATLLQQLVAAGADRGRLRAKVFGGGCLFDSLRVPHSGGDDLGRRNVELAMASLAQERIPIETARVGTNCGLRISFHTGTGNATVTKL